MTPLHCAARDDSEEVVRLLAEYDARLDTPSLLDSATPETLARRAGHGDIVEYLENARRRGRWHAVPDLSAQPLRRIALFFTPVVMLPLSCWTAGTFGLFSWQTLLWAVFAITALARIQRYLWPERKCRSTFPAGVSAASILWLVGVHWFVFWPAADPSTLTQHVATMVIETTLIVTFLYSMFASAGTVPDRRQFVDASSTRDALLADGGVDDEAFCVVCQLIRPLRARHCRLCGVWCVAVF